MLHVFRILISEEYNRHIDMSLLQKRTIAVDREMENLDILHRIHTKCRGDLVPSLIFCLSYRLLASAQEWR